MTLTDIVMAMAVVLVLAVAVNVAVLSLGAGLDLLSGTTGRKEIADGILCVIMAVLLLASAVMLGIAAVTE